MTVVVSVAMTMCVGPALSTVRMRFIKVVLMEVKQSQQHQHKNQTRHDPGHSKINARRFGQRRVGNKMEKSHT